MIFRNSVKIAVIAVLLAVMCVSAHAAGNSSGYAWGENAGWANFNPTGAGVTVYSDHLEGYAWNENIGWIHLGAYTGGGTHTYANTSAADYGVNNNGSGVLSGYGWSENAGWINFKPTGGGVTIDSSGNFSGYAWGENVGWIHFVGTAYKVVTGASATGAGITISSVSNVTLSTVIAYGTATGTGITERGFYVFDEGAYDGPRTPAGSGAGDFSLTLGGLQPNKKYYVRAYAIVSGQFVATAEKIPFTTGTAATDASLVPKVVTSPPSAVSGATVTVDGSITDVGGSSVNVYGFIYNTHPGLVETDPALPFADGFTNPITSPKTFEGILGKMPALPLGTYWFMAYAHNSYGTGFGKEYSFTIGSSVAGDLSNNGKVGLEDVILALRIVAGIPVTDYINPNADVNGDGRIGLEEAVYILQKISGLR